MGSTNGDGDRKGRDHGEGRGREAGSPWHIPWAGWKQILGRTKAQLAKDNIGIVAAGLAFYAMLALFPAVIALVTVYGLVADPAQVQQQVQSMGGMLPESAQEIILDQLSSIAGSSSTSLGWGLVASVGLALWTASGGTKNLLLATSIAYNEEESRGFFKLRGQALIFTLGILVFAVIAIGLIAVLPALFGLLGLGELGTTLIAIGRWPALALAVIFGLAILYRYGPDRRAPRWRWVSFGALAATVLWIAASMGFSFYVSNFSSYNETYGALGGVIVLLLWLFISAFAILLGAELDSEIEHQTARDSTVGEEKPMGEREAVKADTLPGEGNGRRPRPERRPER